MRIVTLQCMVVAQCALSCGHRKTSINEKKNAKTIDLGNLEQELQEHVLTIHDIQEVVLA